jgi:hypothetical protein
LLTDIRYLVAHRFILSRSARDSHDEQGVVRLTNNDRTCRKAASWRPLLFKLGVGVKGGDAKEVQQAANSVDV